MSKEFKKGEVYYLANGQAVEYVAKTEAGHVVYEIYQPSGDEYHSEPEPEIGDAMIVGQLFSEEPELLMSPSIVRMNKEIDDKRAELSKLSQEIYEITRSRETEKQLLARLSKYKALEHLEDMIEKRMTHGVVIQSYGVKVGTFEEVMTSEEEGKSYRRETRLLSLFGASNGDLQWRLMNYKEGGGPGQEIHFFKSEADALAFATESVAKLFGEVSVEHSVYYADQLIKSAMQYGLEIPEDLTARVNAKRAQEAAAVLKRAESELLKAQRALEVAKGTITLQAPAQQ